MATTTKKDYYEILGVKKSASAPAKLVEPDLSATLAGGTMPPQIEPDSPELI